jgi:hypothetical protein
MESVVVETSKPDEPNKTTIVPLPEVKKSLAALPASVLSEFIADLQDAVAKKEGKTWSQWFVSLDKTKVAGWALFAAMTLYTLYQSRNPPVAPPAQNPPIVKPKEPEPGPPPVPSVTPFGGPS